jgi:hypothetical protein
VVEDARIVIGSAACLSVGRRGGGKIAPWSRKPASHRRSRTYRSNRQPLDNTDFDMTWRKKVTAEFVTYALRELRGDDVRTERESFTRCAFE